MMPKESMHGGRGVRACAFAALCPWVCSSASDMGPAVGALRLTHTHPRWRRAEEHDQHDDQAYRLHQRPHRPASAHRTHGEGQRTRVSVAAHGAGR